jgi:hypothetical protein
MVGVSATGITNEQQYTEACKNGGAEIRSQRAHLRSRSLKSWNRGAKTVQEVTLTTQTGNPESRKMLKAASTDLNGPGGTSKQGSSAENHRSRTVGCRTRGARRPRGDREGRERGGGTDLGVEHDGAEDPGLLHGGAEVVERLLVVLVGAVGEVEARDAHAGAQQARDHLDGARGRAERADDLGLGPAPPRGCLPPSRLAARRHR